MQIGQRHAQRKTGGGAHQAVAHRAAGRRTSPGNFFNDKQYGGKDDAVAALGRLNGTDGRHHAHHHVISAAGHVKEIIQNKAGSQPDDKRGDFCHSLAGGLGHQALPVRIPGKGALARPQGQDHRIEHSRKHGLAENAARRAQRSAVHTAAGVCQRVQPFDGGQVFAHGHQIGNHHPDH